MLRKKVAVKDQIFPLMEKATDAITRLDYKEPVSYYLEENLKHTLRSYQWSALWHLDWVETRTDANQNNQLMFNMATGSGKTDIMAAAILYFYREFNYTDFLFVADSNTIIDKTRDNFINVFSSKYLFSAPINIDGQRVEIKEVNSFLSSENKSPHTIYIRLATVQTLGNEIAMSHENEMTLENLQNHKIVILADEAHHLNAKTKSERKKEDSWESMIDKIRNSDTENRQLEFTATIDVDRRDVYEKYKNRIIYKYELDELMRSGYSKRVFRLEANGDNMQKLLNAVLLSEYRKRLAKQLGIPDFKPVILVKSHYVDTSETVEKQFLDMMDNLSSESLKQFLIENQRINTKSSQALKWTYEYWLKQDMVQTVNELKQNFNQLTTINVNRVKEVEDSYKKINSLEDINNPFRIIFAVKKLTEGWDVLNLYDIVKASETKVKNTIAETNSEAQLIGRGARYYPFTYQDKKSYKRRFDDSNPKWQILENLYYHTINDPEYIKRINKAFDRINLIVHKDSEYNVLSANVKKSFLHSHFYRDGKLYYNLQQETTNQDYTDISDYGIDTDVPLIINYNQTTVENSLRQKYKAVSDLDTKIVNVVNFSDSHDYRLISKAVARNDYYRFNTMQSSLPAIRSVKEFLTSPEWLGKLIIRARVPNVTQQLTAIQKLDILDKALKQIQIKIEHAYSKKRGTNIFKPIAVKDIVKDYSKLVPLNSNQVWGTNVEPKDMKGKDWYPYNVAIADGLERKLIDIVGSWIISLKKKYKQDVYLIRNEESVTPHISLHEFEDTKAKHYEGYLPDFILVLSDGTLMYQIYIEPKGEQLVEQDKWKEKLLESIRPENIEVKEDNNIRLYGVKFYTHNDSHHMEEELHTLNILPGNYSVESDLFKPEIKK